MPAEQNPAQWPKFEHIGIWYADRSKHRINIATIPVIFIQRWWRQRDKPRDKQILYPLPKISRFDGSIRNIVKYINDIDGEIDKQFRAFEKLDGTNFGVMCNGATYGRRVRALEKKYQKIELVGNVPTSKQVTRIKQLIIGDDTDDIQFMLYGELMCNPGKFDYKGRLNDHEFYCFGGVVRYPGTFTEENILNYQSKIQSRGFSPVVAGNSGRVVLNEKLIKLLEEVGIASVPLMSTGSLGTVCSNIEDEMMKDGMEGVVLTCEDGGLFKWKTSIEDESATNSKLTTFLKQHSSTVLKFAGVDQSLIECLARVSTPKKKKLTREEQLAAKGAARASSKKTNVYDDAVLQTEWSSATTKYDDVESYFRRDERSVIIRLLTEEITNDLGASTKDELGYIGTFVKKSIGIAFGKWKRSESTI